MTIFWSEIGNLVPRALFPGFGGGTPHLQSQEKRPGDEVVIRSGSGVPGGTPPPRISRNTPRELAIIHNHISCDAK